MTTKNRRPLTVGLIGHGAIGRAVAGAIAEGRAGNVALKAILCRDLHKHRKDEPSSAQVNWTFTDDAEIFSRILVDLVVEAAGQDALRQYGTRVLDLGRHLLITSIGALTDDAFFGRLVESAEKNASTNLLDFRGFAGGGLDGGRSSNGRLLGGDNPGKTGRLVAGNPGSGDDRPGWIKATKLLFRRDRSRGGEPFSKEQQHHGHAGTGHCGTGQNQGKTRCRSDPYGDAHGYRIQERSGEFAGGMERRAFGLQSENQCGRTFYGDQSSPKFDGYGLLWPVIFRKALLPIPMLSF